MEETYLLNYPGVKKKILAGGKGPLPHFPPGTKLVFHFQTLLDNFERTVIDDSRLACRPAEIFTGKMFKMEIWEPMLTSMRVGEVAEFWCDAIHTGLYPIVSKGMRLIAQGKDPLEGQKHMCGMGNLFHYHSTGFPELDEIMRNPQPLIFIMELLQVGDPLSYHRESWMMEKDEKLQTVPVLHMQGNALVKQKQFREAASKYKEAVLLLKTVQSREMPGDVDYINLGRMIVPLELNYCQCMLELEEYYEVIEHTTELLEKHKDCVKGYYKRAKAHAAVWNEKEARGDFSMVAKLDITLAALVRQELKALSERIKEKYWEEKEQYWNMLETMEGNSKEEEEEEGHDDEKTVKDEERKKRDSEGDLEGGATATKAGEKTDSSEIKCVEQEESGEEKVTPAEGFREEESSSVVELDACDKFEGKDWQQMLRLVMLLQSEGNFLIKEQHFQEASAKFKEALEYVDVLQNKVDQHGEDWESLEKVRLPLSLNLSQCMLELKRYQEVVELNGRLLRSHEGNFKAVYQRARAHAALRNEEEARRDFATVEKLDPKFKPFVRQELKMLGENMRTRHALQNKNYWETTKEKWGPSGSRTKGLVRKKNSSSAKKATEENNEMDKKRESGDVEASESPEDHYSVETEGGGDTETGKSLDVKAERCEQEQKCGRASELRSDKEKTGRVEAPGADNHKADRDSDLASTSSDNVERRGSACDKGKKVKRQSRDAPNPNGTKSGTGKGDSIRTDQ